MTDILKKIDLTDIEGFDIRQKDYEEAGTGSTVILCEGGAVTGIDIRGGAPASRESGLLNPLAANDAVQAVLLTGGSAYGLDAATGIMKYLEEQGKGFPIAGGVVPIVCASSIFDLAYGDFHTRPDAEFGYDLCRSGESFRPGNHGAGTGATIGKAMGAEGAMKSGIGSAAYQIGELKVGAVVVVNALGDVYENGKKIAGLHDPSTHSFIDTEDIFYQMQAKAEEHGNTTIGAIITNGAFNKTQLTKIAGLGHDGMARAIRPVHTSFDGDTLYALSHGTVKADADTVGMLAAKVVEEAIVNAVKSAEDSHGLISFSSL